jgi:predicted nucleotidyltransferase
MTKIVGITAEYNPFHNGHRRQIDILRRQYRPDVVLAVMSGSFVQRGEPAVLDKFTRAEAACENGIDAVLELPYVYAVQSASRFARGAIEVLKLAGADAVCFGSECGSLENLKEIAAMPIQPDNIRASLNTGLSFPKAYSLLTSEMMPNDILAVCYLKAMKNTGMEPILIPRSTNYLDPELHGSQASALAIRTALAQGRDPGPSTPMRDVLMHSFLPRMELYYPYLRTYLLTADPEYLSTLFLFSEGIENHLIACARHQADWNSFLRQAVTRRYTASRIRRTLIQVLTQTTRKEVEKLPRMESIRVLAFNETGQAWLRSCRGKDMHIASRFADVPFPYRKMEYRAALAYTSVFPEEKRREILQQEISGAHRIVTVPSAE